MDIIESAQKILQSYGDMPVDELMQKLLKEKAGDMDFDRLYNLPPTTSEELEQIKEGILALAVTEQDPNVFTHVFTPPGNTMQDVAETLKRLPTQEHTFTLRWRKYPFGEYREYTFTDPEDAEAQRIMMHYYMGEIADIELRSS